MILWSESRETDLYVLYTTDSCSGQNRYHLAALRAAIGLTIVDRFTDAKLDRHFKGHQGSCHGQEPDKTHVFQRPRDLPHCQGIGQDFAEEFNAGSSAAYSHINARAI